MTTFNFGKKALFLAIFLAIAVPSTSFAYDALTPKESVFDLVPNFNFLLKADYQKYCYDEQVRVERGMGTASQELTGWQLSRKIETLNLELSDLVNKCNEIKEQINTQAAPTLEENRRIGCGTDYIKRGGKCVTPTESCQLYFGNNVSGIKSPHDVDVAECTCNAGFTLASRLCIAQVAPSTQTAVALATVNTVDTVAQMKAIIAQLTALIAQLMKAKGM